MARLSRIVVPGCPHHVTQRGNRRGQTFFEDGDYELYKNLLNYRNGMDAPIRPPNGPYW